MSRRRRRVDPGPRVDLHCHSTASDGLLDAQEVLKRAASAGLSALAITDHDLPPVIEPGMHRFGERSIRLIGGVELSTMHRDKELHLLVYFPNAMPEQYAEWCRSRAQWRATWFDECGEALGLPSIRACQAAREGRRTLTRLHLAKAVVEAGVCTSLSEAFNDYVGHSCQGIPPLNMSFLDALNVAKEWGGWTSWAHPPVSLADAWAADFAHAGLDAMESHRPNKSGRNRIAAIAHQHGMGLTGGSDWHGWGKRKMGSFRVPARALHKTDKALNLLN